MNVNTPPYKGEIADKKGMATDAWTRMFNSWFLVLQAVRNYGVTSPQTPLTGFTIQMADNADTLILTPAGTLAAGTIALPANPFDGMQVKVASSQTITALTITSASAILNAPTTLSGGTGFSFTYVKAVDTWMRLY